MDVHQHQTKRGNISHSHLSAEDLQTLTSKRLVSVFLITFIFMIVEFVGGYISGSLALIADAGHMLNDSFSLLLALVAMMVGTIQPTRENSFGFRRVEVFSGLLNGLSLLAISIFIIKEAISRVNYVTELDIQGRWMFIVAILGLGVNLIGIQLLRTSKSDSLNVEGAYEHIIADLFGSIAAIIASLGILLFNWYWLDLLASSLVSLMILRSGGSITIRAIKILLETSPEGINLEQVINDFSAIQGVIDIHDLHAWRVTSNWDVIMTHVTVEEESNQQLILQSLQIVAQDHGFKHPTFQIEFLRCNTGDCIAD